MDKNFSKIFLDFDSTLIRAESLDLLGDMCGVGEEVRKITDLTMAGVIPIEEVFKKKVDLISPSLSQVRDVAKQCENLLVDDIREVISALHSSGKKVFIISSNFHHLVDPVAKILGIPEDCVIANDLYFDEDGNYRGFNHSSPLCSSSGKAVMLRRHLRRGERAVLVGDGSTDLCCKGIVDLLIGFGGVAERPVVRENADTYFAGPSFAPLLSMILTPIEMSKLNKSEFEKLLNKVRATTPTTTTTNPPGSW
ncbi:MAG: Phosphoserine phosphatase [Syntrophomonadaceae bacterium]|nr:Phosphoserine phosphatase [Bacillota bacterium]